MEEADGATPGLPVFGDSASDSASATTRPMTIMPIIHKPGTTTLGPSIGMGGAFHVECASEVVL